MRCTVVIPIHNRAHLLRRALASVAAQSFHSFEVVVVDDASIDDPRQIVEEMRDDRFRCIRLQHNQGAAGARNAGFAEARGDLISLLDSDDEMDPDFLRSTSEVFEACPTLGFTWTGKRTVRHEVEGFLKRTRITEAVWEPVFNSREEGLEYCLAFDPPWGTSHGVTLKRGVLESVGGFDSALRAREDVDILLRLISRHEYAVIPRILMTLHNDAGVRVDGNVLARAEAYVRMYEKYRTNILASDRAKRFFGSMITDSFSDGGSAVEAMAWLARQMLRSGPEWWMLRRSLGLLVARMR